MKLFYLIFGRSLTWRLGRALYQYSRGDIQNRMDTNGEIGLLRAVVGAWLRDPNNQGPLTVFDVGANVGDWAANVINTLPPSKRNSLHLHMFEPIPETNRVLRERISAAPAGAQCHFHDVALSSKSGTATMSAQGDSGTNSLNPGESKEESLSISVTVCTLSEFAARAGIEKINIVKCDTEGHDMEVITGAFPMLKAGRIQVMQFEYNYRWLYSRHYLKDVFDAMSGLPYRIGKLMPEGIELYPQWHFELERFFESNFVLIHSDSLAAFNAWEVTFSANNTPAVTKKQVRGYK